MNLLDNETIAGTVVYCSVELIKTSKSWQVLVNKEPVLITTNELKARRVYDKYSAIMKQQEIRKRGRTHQRGKRTLLQGRQRSLFRS
jgi:ribosomal protein S21